MSDDLQTPTQAEIREWREAVERAVRKVREADPVDQEEAE